MDTNYVIFLLLIEPIVLKLISAILLTGVRKPLTEPYVLIIFPVQRETHKPGRGSTGQLD